MGRSGWKRLGRRIQTERVRQGFEIAAELAEAAGVSVRTVEILEAGTHTGRPRDTTLSKIEEALGWQDGSCLAIVAGGRPRKLRDLQLARIHRMWPRLDREERDAVAALVETYARRR